MAFPDEPDESDRIRPPSTSLTSNLPKNRQMPLSVTVGLFQAPIYLPKGLRFARLFPPTLAGFVFQPAGIVTISAAGRKPSGYE